jgi:hypothetical protein
MSRTQPLTETERKDIQAVIAKADARIEFLCQRYNEQSALQELENIRAQADAVLTASQILETAIQTCTLLEPEFDQFAAKIETLRTQLDECSPRDTKKLIGLKEELESKRGELALLTQRLSSANLESCRVDLSDRLKVYNELNLSLIHKVIPFNEKERAEVEAVIDQAKDRLAVLKGQRGARTLCSHLENICDHGVALITSSEKLGRVITKKDELFKEFHLVPSEVCDLDNQIEAVDPRTPSVIVDLKAQLALKEAEMEGVSERLSGYDVNFYRGDFAQRLSHYRQLDFSLLAAEVMPRDLDLLHRVYEHAQKVTPNRY